ncbi:unnamed protein product [Trichobilharzia regenti]|nr:unnamed protein product [Trichobilharzia regenti]
MITLSLLPPPLKSSTRQRVNFNEPLSFLQRAVEDFTYSYLLDRASQTSDPVEQIAYVAAFSVSCYSSTAYRTGKPFNSLLGETYECDRTDDLGWRCILEQVRDSGFVCVCMFVFQCM